MSSEDLSPKAAFLKAASYCAYQERAPLEVSEKLTEWGILDEALRNEIMQGLKSERFLDEGRFAEIYAGGKFRIKKWGRLKIRQGLRQKGISTFHIEQALRCIPTDAYYDTLYELLVQKNHSLRESDVFKRKQKLLRFAASKGYESGLIYEVLNDL